MRQFLETTNESTVNAYRHRRELIREHFEIEQNALGGAYGCRQVLELVQNGADAILEGCGEGQSTEGGNRIAVVLRDGHLYAANTGAPLSQDGLNALLLAYSSPKRGRQIGRFGIGFKSLLRLGGRIDIFTRAHGAIRFDPERCRNELHKNFDVGDAPGLRLAWPLDEAPDGRDSVLEQMTWAETIVRAEVCTKGVEDELRKELAGFPAEFLLFLAVSATLDLDDGVTVRRLSVALEPDASVLHDGDDKARWHLARRDIEVTDEAAIKDATALHRRGSVPLIWAFPLDGKREDAGPFWAFFPTQTPSRMPGILNAAWKVNSDRSAVLPGAWNEALMREAARLIVDQWNALVSQDDPGRILDLFPRQLERQDEVAAPLVEAVWAAVEATAVIPDGVGTLRLPHVLYRHPARNETVVRSWLALASEKIQAQLVHPSCLVGQRESRLAGLAKRMKPEVGVGAELPALRATTFKWWFGAVCSTDSETACDVLQLAEALKADMKSAEWEAVRKEIEIIPTMDGKIVSAESAVLAPEGVTVPGMPVVSQELCAFPRAREALKNTMRVGHLDDAWWTTQLATRLSALRWYEPVDDSWKAFWVLLRSAPEPLGKAFAQRNVKEILVRRRDDQWAHPDAVLLPGELVDENDPRESASALVDARTHALDHALLRILGVSEFPNGISEPCAVGMLYKAADDWLEHWRSIYLSGFGAKSGRPQPVKTGPLDLCMPRGWRVLALLGGTANARFAERLFCGQVGGCKSIAFGHFTMSARYKPISVAHLLPWLLCRYGLVQLGDKAVRLAALVLRAGTAAITSLPGWVRLHPICEAVKGVEPAPKVSATEFTDLWSAVIELMATPEALARGDLGVLWAAAAADGFAPVALASARGSVPLRDVRVTASADMARRARDHFPLVVSLEGHALALWLDRGARRLEDDIAPLWDAQSGMEELLLDVFPEFADVVLEEWRAKLRCEQVARLVLRVGPKAIPTPCLLRTGSLLVDTERLAALPRAARLRAVLSEVAATGCLDGSLEDVLQRLGDARVDERRAHVADGQTPAERLQRAVGGRVAPLRRALGALGEADFIAECGPAELAALVLAQLGTTVLSELREALDAEGLKPPTRWGGAEARSFVATIGFPVEYADAPANRREPEEIISGPIRLPPLHDFQKEVLGSIGSLLALGSGRRRAVISLPTGGGKTRVTVEAAVRLVLAPKGVCRSVLWIAQTDELCEQAVQAFRQVWLNCGSEGTNLRIVRLWGGNPTPSAPEGDRPVAVIASIQTLNNRMGTSRLEWLQHPGLVVVDECHHAITPSYTNLLRWLNAEAPRPGAQPKDEPPMLGLSATPFRMDDEESQRLARRFDGRWFPTAQEDLHRRLRVQGVLSDVKHEALPSNGGLTAGEVAELEKLPEQWQGLDFDALLERINQRLAGNQERNQLLVECVSGAPERSILLFANSVAHGAELAARLTLLGISAAAVSGETSRTARRFFLERFQRGEIRVLCNHSVLTTGFDAPRTDMVLIARQVFSPVRYMQMVGRGLRGEKNGGTASCRIVTVLDNLGRFRDRHPYHFCQKYFEETAPVA